MDVAATWTNREGVASEMPSSERDHDFGYQMMKRMSAIVIARLQATRKKLAEAEAKS